MSLMRSVCCAYIFFIDFLFISGNTAHGQEKTRQADRNRQNTKTHSKTHGNITTLEIQLSMLNDKITKYF